MLQLPKRYKGIQSVAGLRLNAKAHQLSGTFVLRVDGSPEPRKNRPAHLKDWPEYRRIFRNQEVQDRFRSWVMECPEALADVWFPWRNAFDELTPKQRARIVLSHFNARCDHGSDENRRCDYCRMWADLEWLMIVFCELVWEEGFMEDAVSELHPDDLQATFERVAPGLAVARYRLRS